MASSPDREVAVGVASLLPVGGFRLASIAAGLKKNGRPDVTLMSFPSGSSVAAVFTQNAFAAAPVLIAKNNLAEGRTRALLVNAGNANAGTGSRGLDDARTCCAAVGSALSIDQASVLPFSTGVIGEPLPVERITGVIGDLADALTEDGWPAAAHAIMTTDTVPKGISRRVNIGDESFVITGIAKGAGMIRPNMATMLGYIATDAAVSKALAQQALERAVAQSFNRITVDGDTSTNDAVTFVATGVARMETIQSENQPAYELLVNALTDVCEQLALAIVRDAEGATKLITVEVTGGLTESETDAVAYTVAHSPLVKTAFYAADANWGRILAAVGRAGVEELRVDGIRIWLDELLIVEQGGRATSYTEARGSAIMQQPEILVRIDLARGEASSRIWTCDLSHDYVTINAEYRT